MGVNVASYKFALGDALIRFAAKDQTFVSMEELAKPFSEAICKHLSKAPKQGVSATSRFLDACRAFNAGTSSLDQLHEATVRLGFVNVIDAFHIVNGSDVPNRFFKDDRKARKGITLTDELMALGVSEAKDILPREIEARWRLVETAWDMEISPALVAVEYDESSGHLHVQRRPGERVDVTSARDALNGYQKGVCFYCYRPISIVPGSEDMGDVDHVFPISLQAKLPTVKFLNVTALPDLNGVWNLVLACKECNRGQGGKSAHLAHAKYIQRLNTRNEFLIASHHPLRESLKVQTGGTIPRRQASLRFWNDQANLYLNNPWEAKGEQEPKF
jgi:hypothetical protein